MSYTSNAGDWSAQLGPTIKLPLSHHHNVQPGETMASIAAQHGHSLDTLMRLNSHLVGQDQRVSPDMRLNV